MARQDPRLKIKTFLTRYKGTSHVKVQQKNLTMSGFISEFLVVKRTWNTAKSRKLLTLNNDLAWQLALCYRAMASRDFPLQAMKSCSFNIHIKQKLAARDYQGPDSQPKLFCLPELSILLTKRFWRSRARHQATLWSRNQWDRRALQSNIPGSLHGKA